MKRAYLYCDEGAGAFSVYAAKNHFRDYKITLITAAKIIADGIPDYIDLFIMPGGADRPYAKKLNGAGNQIIKNYIQNGGAYLGICAGAYFGCARIEFQKGTKHEICESRELALFDGVGMGCLTDIAPVYDNTLSSAAIANLSIYWGGCSFEGVQDAVNIISRYEDIKGAPPAIISTAYGKGSVILSGVHFEVSAQSLAEYDFQNQQDNDLKSPLAQTLDNAPCLSFDKIMKEHDDYLCL